MKNTKHRLAIVLSCIATFMSGCAAYTPSTAGKSMSVTIQSYDPAKDVTTISGENITWYVRGNLTNLIGNPTIYSNDSSNWYSGTITTNGDFVRRTNVLIMATTNEVSK